MKNNFLLIASGVVLAIGALTSCSNDKNQEPASNSDQTLHFYVEGVETRTSTGNFNKNTIEENNTVGIFGISSGNTVKNGTNNIYTVGTGGALTATTDMTAKERSSLDVFAYAPHNMDWNTHTTSYDFSVKTDQSEKDNYIASDLLYAEKTTINNVSSTQNTVGLTFKHKMARVILNISKAAGADDLSEAKVTVNNVMTTIPFTPETGALGDAKGGVSNITALSVLGQNKEVYAVVVPQKLESGTTLFTITTSDRNFSLQLADEVTFAPGNSYTYNVTVQPTELQDVTITLTTVPTVTDWDEQTGQEATDAVESSIN